MSARGPANSVKPNQATISSYFYRSYEIMKVKDKIRAKLAVFLTVLSAFGAYLIAKFSRREYDHIWDTEAATVKPDFDKKKPLS